MNAAHQINPALLPLAVPLAKLKPDPHNARRHDAAGIATIRASLRRFGQQKPVVALEDGTVIAGNGTLAAAREEGWTALAAVTFPDAEQARAYAIADNRAGELSEWDVSELLDQVKGVGDAAELGFSPADIDALLDDVNNPFRPEFVNVADLRAHPRNYRKHPEDQLQQIIASVKAHGYYRNVVIARDGTILAGHGVWLATQRMGRKRMPVVRTDLDPNDPRALRIMTSDNEIGRLAEVDDRALTELLKEILGSGEDGLAGTGFDEQQLAALALVTRPASEIKGMDEAAAWVGMPEYEEGGTPIKLVITFPNEEERARFCEQYSVKLDKSAVKGTTFSTRWPWTDREDNAAVRFVAGEQQPEDAPPPEVTPA